MTSVSEVRVYYKDLKKEASREGGLESIMDRNPTAQNSFYPPMGQRCHLMGMKKLKFISGDEDAGESYEKALPVKELFEKITVEDKLILPLCLYALISGNLEYDVELDDPAKRAKIWGSYIASDVFMRNSSP
eukprot:scaffold36066_cov52-Attheya_sp.AAC.2